MISHREHVIERELSGEVAEGKPVLLFEGALPRPGRKVCEPEDQEAALGHVPEELALREVEVHPFDDGLADEVLHSVLQVPLAGVGLRYDSQVDELRRET